ncbi:hypothetical protein [Victivallis sp. Marseille-Q1083]|uniref:hypothetical protein n=1 Tax=Victivallis sp. Marseille-Q1083 TaxID=2717288 RepID=UPI0015887526|nr:hypothetical protein [Victivallis sp. Marseille-Q1083]
MQQTVGKQILGGALAVLAAVSAAGQETAMPVDAIPAEKVQKIRFVEDDAQNYMVSKLYELKHQQANDLVPFILGAIKRYAENGSADRINYAAGGKQFVSVSCPEPLMPYIDDMIAKLDRPGARGPDGSGIDGTGIVRSVYTPVWRSSETMMNVMIKAGISSNATEGANQDAVVAFDAATNRIYWKDSIRKDEDMKKYLAWLDRPVPQFTISLKVYDVRESSLRDLGIDYLAWKNGPGLNLFEAGATFLEGSALENSFGPYGFFLFAPSFDFSFVRLLQQDGRARLATSASLSIATGHDAKLKFTPAYQNLVKDDKFASAVAASANDKLELTVTEPVIALSGKTDRKTGQLGYSEADYAAQCGVLNFFYTLEMQNVVERDNHGNELYETVTTIGAFSIQTGAERLLSRWVREEEVEQTIGVPFLCELPVLKYLFGTTTRTTEKHFYFVAVKAELLHPDAEIAAVTGKLLAASELVNPEER